MILEAIKRIRDGKVGDGEIVRSTKRLVAIYISQIVHLPIVPFRHNIRRATTVALSNTGSAQYIAGYSGKVKHLSKNVFLNWAAKHQMMASSLRTTTVQFHLLTI